MELIFKIVWLLLVYFLGSVPFGLVLGRVCCKIDVRTAGSGNVGATNVARLCGFKWGVLTLFLDAAKGAVPVALAQYLLPSLLPALIPDKTLATFVGLTGLAAVLGHLYSYFLKFRGGKAVATTVGVYLVLLPGHLIVAAALCIFVIRRWGYVSLGSITLVCSMPILMIFSGMFTRDFSHIVLVAVIAGLVVNSHMDNIVRLIAGEEKTWRKADLAADFAAKTEADDPEGVKAPEASETESPSPDGATLDEEHKESGLKGI